METEKDPKKANDDNITQEIKEKETKMKQDKKLEALQKENDDLKDQLLRLAAEYNNFRKRSAKEKEELYKCATSDVIESFLPAIDCLELAVANIGKSAKIEDLEQGLELMYRQLKEILDKIDVNEIPSIGEKFNPDLHEAVMHVTDDNFGENEVIEELKKGYTYKDKVIRHSMVKVAN